MDCVFDAFPNAIVSGVWSIGQCQHGTLIGNEYMKVADLDVIVDDGASSSINATPEGLSSDLLIYAMPCQMPTTSANKLVSAYMLHNMEEDAYYAITDVGMGKNQHTGVLEHIELRLTQTEVVDA